MRQSACCLIYQMTVNNFASLFVISSWVHDFHDSLRVFCFLCIRPSVRIGKQTIRPKKHHTVIGDVVHKISYTYGRPRDCHNKITKPSPSTQRKMNSFEQKQQKYNYSTAEKPVLSIKTYVGNDRAHDQCANKRK